MGKKVTKRTKKFARKHLKSTIEKRRKTKPFRNALKKKQAAYLKSQSGFTKASQKDGSSHVSKRDDQHIQDLFVENDCIGSDTSTEEEASENESLPSEEEASYLDAIFFGLDEDNLEGDSDNDTTISLQGENTLLKSQIEECNMKLEKIKKKDPKFSKFLAEHSQELWDEENSNSEDEAEDPNDVCQKHSNLEKRDMAVLLMQSKSFLTTTHFNVLCQEIKENQSIQALKCLLQYFRAACSYGTNGKNLSLKFTISRSNVYKQIVLFTLDEMDCIFRKWLKLPVSGGKKEMVMEIKNTKRWREIEVLIRSYFSSTCSLLNEMTDDDVIVYILEQLGKSIILLSAFPYQSRKVAKVAVNMWATGIGLVSGASFIFVRKIIAQLGSDCFQYCLKKLYNTFKINCKLVNSTNYKQIEFLKCSIVEICGLDLANAFGYAFASIKTLAMLLQCALTSRKKESIKEIYSWKYINCLEIWVKFVCAFAEHCQSFFYPLAQILMGVLRLMPSSRYSPLRLLCVSMLNKLASAAAIFIPVSYLLLDILDFKEFDKAVNEKASGSSTFSTILKVPKPMLKSRAFQDECVYSVLDLLAEHLAQWSYHVAFPDLAFPILVRLHRFYEQTAVDRFRRQVKQLIDQVECNTSFVCKKRENVSFAPKDSSAVSLFLQAEKASSMSPLSKYYATLQQKEEFKKFSLRRARAVPDDKFTVNSHKADKEEDKAGMNAVSHHNSNKANENAADSRKESLADLDAEDSGSPESSDADEDADFFSNGVDDDLKNLEKYELGNFHRNVVKKRGNKKGKSSKPSQRFSRNEHIRKRSKK